MISNPRKAYQAEVACQKAVEKYFACKGFRDCDPQYNVHNPLCPGRWAATAMGTAREAFLAGMKS